MSQNLNHWRKYVSFKEDVTFLSPTAPWRWVIEDEIDCFSRDTADHNHSQWGIDETQQVHLQSIPQCIAGWTHPRNAETPHVSLLVHLLSRLNDAWQLPSQAYPVNMTGTKPKPGGRMAEIKTRDYWSQTNRPGQLARKLPNAS